MFIEPQESILNTLANLGIELEKRRKIAVKNIETAKERGYENYYNWEYKNDDSPLSRIVNLFTKMDGEDKTE